MSDQQTTVLARCREVGIDVSMASGLDATISAKAKSGSVRELPRISVDLDEKSPLKIERDLEVLGLLGEGGMGRVLLAKQHSLDREVAIKTLREGATDKERAALVSEGAITGHLEHPTIIPVHALGVDSEGSPVLVMKRVVGVEWSALLDDAHHEAWGDDPRDRLTAHLEILMQVCNAAHFAHSRRIVHRDIKPHNVLVGRFGEVYLGDWGLAVRVDKEWQPQPLCGTPAYMAPEMVVGGAVDERTDVYLLGATLHHILTGESRNQGVTACEALLGAVDTAPQKYPPSVPEELAALANRCCACDPSDRLASALEVKQAIAAYLSHRSSVVLGQSAAERVGKMRQIVAAGALGEASTQGDLDRLAVEARFALEQALREWPENAAAARAQRELEEMLAARRARAAELERLARDLDPAVSARQRAAVTLALAVVGVGLSVYALAGGGGDLDPRLLFYQSLGPLAVLAAATVLMWRHAQATALNRRMLLGALASIGGITAARALGLVAGVSAPQMLIYDCLLVGVVSLMLSAIAFRWVAWGGLVMATAGVWAAFDPGRAMMAFSLGTGVSLCAVAVLAWKQK